MSSWFIPYSLSLFLGRNFPYFENKMFRDFQSIVEEGELIRLRKIMNQIIDFESKSIVNIRSMSDSSSLMNSVKIFRSCDLVDKLIFNQKIVRTYTISVVYEKRFSYPIPPKYWRFFENNEVAINKSYSYVKWITYETVASIKQIIKTVFECIKPTNYKTLHFGSTVIIGLQAKTLTKTSSDEMCFESWLTNKLDSSSKLYGLDLGNVNRHGSDVENFSSKNIFDYKLSNLTKMLVRILIFQLSIVEFKFTARYFHEIYKFKYMNSGNKNKIKTLITVASSSWVKPVWLNNLDFNSCRIIYINLSASSSPSISNEDPVYGWENLNVWNEIWVLDSYQNKMFASGLTYVGDKVFVKGCPYWTDSLKPFIDVKLDGSYLAIFDIQPTRKFLGWSGLYDCGYYDSKAILIYIRDIISVAASLHITCVLKSKRSNPRFTDMDYYDGIEGLRDEFPNLIYVDAEISPHRIIMKSIATISIPFTSTSLIASDYGVPTLFYDPIGKVMRNDPVARGIDVISGQAQLYTVLSELKNKQ